MLMAVMHVFSVMLVVIHAQVYLVLIVVKDIIKMVMHALNVHSHA